MDDDDGGLGATSRMFSPTVVKNQFGPPFIGEHDDVSKHEQNSRPFIIRTCPARLGSFVIKFEFLSRLD